MSHPLLIRILLGAAGLAGCLAVLSGVARAADLSNLDRPIIVSTVVQPNVFGTVTLSMKPGRYDDYWASAQETLEHGVGDMEDRAIVKMQALRALGFPTRDLYLTMGRDKVGGPVTVLIVRSGGRYVVLDDSAGAPFTTDHRPEFTPMLTFGFGGSWIHGYRYVGRSPEQRGAAPAAIRSAFATR